MWVNFPKSNGSGSGSVSRNPEHLQRADNDVPPNQQNHVIFQA